MNETDLLEDRSAGAEGPADTATGTSTSADAPRRRRASRPVGEVAAAGTNGIGTNGTGTNGTGTTGTTGTTGPGTNGTGAGTGATDIQGTGGLAGKLLPELQQIAGGLGISGLARLRKGQLISAIQEARGGTTTTASAPAEPSPPAVPPVATSRSDEAPAPRAETGESRQDGDGQQDRPRRRSTYEERQRAREQRAAQGDQGTDQARDSGPDRGGEQGRTSQANHNGTARTSHPGGQSTGPGTQRDDDDEDFDSRRSRRGRYRDRRRGTNRPGGGGQTDAEPAIRDDDVLAPVAGILDMSDSYAFLRTSGYLPGPKDVYVSMNLVRRNGLRRGDAITGVVRANAGEGEQQGPRREKYVPLVRLDTINGVTPEEARDRPEFGKLTPLYPQERLRLETDSSDLVTRVIDLVMPIGKGQRALIVSPPKAGKTTVLQRIANAITENNPECHLMVVLVDERPEEVTDMQRSVKGEVIASTFDRPASDHTTLSELAIERAKRLVELGHDVVVMLDNLTRLGRAYNLAAPASGRILSGGVDSAALYPPKRFLGAARNIENGGSLTILATALVETGSTMDTVIFEEFKGTGNAELILSRKIADKRIFPAVDIDPSSTRKDELLMSPEEHAVVQKLRRVLHALDSQSAIELLLNKLKETPTNIQFLQQIAKTTPGE